MRKNKIPVASVPEGQRVVLQVLKSGSVDRRINDKAPMLEVRGRKTVIFNGQSKHDALAVSTDKKSEIYVSTKSDLTEPMTDANEKKFVLGECSNRFYVPVSKKKPIKDLGKDEFYVLHGLLPDTYYLVRQNP